MLSGHGRCAAPSCALDELERADARSGRHAGGQQRSHAPVEGDHARCRQRGLGGEPQTVELAHASGQRVEHQRVVHLLIRLAACRHGDLEGARAAHVASLGGEEQLIPRELLVEPAPELGVGGGHVLAREAEQLPEAHPVLPQGFSVRVAERSHEALVEPRRGVHEVAHRPQHQLGVQRVVRRARWMARARALVQLAFDAPVHARDRRQRGVRLCPVAEVHALEHRRRARKALERRGEMVGVFGRAHVVERLQRPNAQRPLPIQRAHAPLVHHPPQHRLTAREIAIGMHELAG